MPKIKIGDAAIPFTLPGVDGQNHTLSDYSNKAIVVIIFSCNHCPYVRAWQDRMVQIQADYANKHVQMIAINANDTYNNPDDSFANMKKQALENGFNFIYLYNESQNIARAYGAERTPEVFLFDHNSILQYHGAIDDNFQEPHEVTHHYLRDALDAVINHHPPPLIETRVVGCTIKWK